MKKLAIFILFFISCFGVLASDESQSKMYSISSFEKGLDTHTSKYYVGKNKGSEAENVRFNDEFGAVSKRAPMLSYASIGAYKVTSLHRLYRSDDTQFLLATGSTNVYLGDDDAKTWSVISSGYSDSARWSWITYQDIAIGGNGVNLPIKYDGSKEIGTADGDRTSGNLCAQLGAPFAEIDAGTNLDASKWYAYKILFSDGSNIYYTDSVSNSVLTGSSDHDCALTDIPLGLTGTTQRQIYRTEGQTNKTDLATATFKYVATLNDNTTTSYADNIGDGSLGVDFSTTGALEVTPPIGDIFAIAQERLFVSGNPTSRSDVYWSEQYKPDFFLATSYAQCRPDDGDEVTFLQTLLGILTVGKTNTIQKFYTSGATTTWYFSNPYSFIGCPAQFSACSTPIGILFLGRYGLYNFNGQSVSLISDAVTPEIRDVDNAYYSDAFGYYWNNEYRLAYSSNAEGVGHNDRVLVYDVIRDAYSLDTIDVNCMTALESGSDFGTLYFGSSLGNGWVTKIGAAETFLTKRYKSDLDSGKFDDTRSFGTEVLPYVELAWDLTGDANWSESGYSYAGDMTSSGGVHYLGAREDKNGSWTSPVYFIEADELKRLYWNEDLNTYGDIAWQIRCASESGNINIVPWSSEVSDPSGSDLSGITADNYVQLRANFSTSDILYTPQLEKSGNYVFKLTYSKDGTEYETSMNSIWESGWTDFDVPEYAKLLKRIRIFYQGTEGTLYVNYKSLDGSVDKTFAIDLSIETEQTDAFGGKYQIADDGYKIYSWYPSPNEIDEHWMIKIYDTGIKNWKVNRVSVLWWAEEIQDI